MKQLPMIAVGEGHPLVMVPGIQGRWEWQRPALTALSRRCRAVTYSLCGEPGTGRRLTLKDGFDVHVDQLDRVLDKYRLDRVALCGVSYGGWVSVRYAARRPERVSTLVLVSAPAPRFRPDARHLRYMRAPWLFLPAFFMTTRGRLRPEVLKALPDAVERKRLTRKQLVEMTRAPISPGVMARRIQLAMREDFVSDCRRITAPTLVLTGESGLDRVVPVESTREYLKLIPNAVGAELAMTGHIGLITRPDEWADIVCGFVERVRAEREAGRPAPSEKVLDETLVEQGIGNRG
jgi:pimeloyl-ACP methyl ester carboxylesterase